MGLPPTKNNRGFSNVLESIVFHVSRSSPGRFPELKIFRVIKYWPTKPTAFQSVRKSPASPPDSSKTPPCYRKGSVAYSLYLFFYFTGYGEGGQMGRSQQGGWREWGQKGVLLINPWVRIILINIYFSAYDTSNLCVRFFIRKRRGLLMFRRWRFPFRRMIRGWRVERAWKGEEGGVTWMEEIQDSS